jgi:hypothetical protein
VTLTFCMRRFGWALRQTHCRNANIVSVQGTLTWLVTPGIAKCVIKPARSTSFLKLYFVAGNQGNLEVSQTARRLVR